MAELKLLSTMGLAGVVRAFGPEWERAHGVRLDAVFEPTQVLMQRIRAGERADVAVLMQEGVDALVADQILLGRTDLARSYVGLAVRAGAPHPAIGSADEVAATLLAARSVVMSKAGASGIFFAGLLERLGIAEQVRAKTTVIPGGFTAELVARGEAEIAVQQISELMVVPGVEIVGRLPAAIEGVSVFSAGVFRGAAQADLAVGLVAALAGPDRHALYAACGLECVSA